MGRATGGEREPPNRPVRPERADRDGFLPRPRRSSSTRSSGSLTNRAPRPRSSLAPRAPTRCISASICRWSGRNRAGSDGGFGFGARLSAMNKTTNKVSPEARERAVRWVLDSAAERCSGRAEMFAMAPEAGCRRADAERGVQLRRNRQRRPLRPHHRDAWADEGDGAGQPRAAPGRAVVRHRS